MNFKTSYYSRRLAVLLLLALPVTASAHTVISGAGDFFGGVLHPLTTPSHVLLLLGLGLYLGQHSPLNLKTPLAVFVPVSGLALGFTTTGFIKTVPPPMIISLALLSGVLVALETPPAAWVSRGLFALAALALGLDSAVETGSGLTVVKTLLGTWTGLMIAVGDVAYYSSKFTTWRWQRVGLRVAGSWITAASLMILAFALRHP